MASPELVKIAHKYEGRLNVVRVDVDVNSVLSEAFNITSIPTVAYFRPGKDENGKAYTPQGVIGFRPAEQLEKQFDLSSLLLDLGHERPE
jgi:thioredoxin-like negative regulator of GroEL